MILYNRSIYFEIVSLSSTGEAIQLLESFAFTIPPQNININTPQRITVTQTPGGNFVDNYGLGNAQITIDGETGNEESRLTILGAGKTPKVLTGQEAYFEFRDRIERYSLKDENYGMRFYDLTHKGSGSPLTVSLTEGARGRFVEAWEVALISSGTNRGYSKPFWYPYKIQLEGLRPLGTYNANLATNRLGLLSDIGDFIDSINTQISNFEAVIDAFLSDNLQFLDQITEIKDSVVAFTSQIESFEGLVEEYEYKIAGAFSDVLSTSESILEAGVLIISFPYNSIETARSIFEDLVTQTNDLVTSAKAEGLNTLDLYSWDTTEDPVSEIEQSLNDVQEPFYETVLIAKQTASTEPVGAVAINGSVSSVYGYKTTPIKGNTTLEVLARDEYGDPDAKDIIASVNNIYSNADLVSGDTLLLPLLVPQTRYSNIAVYNTPDNRSDILGKDAKVDNDGIFRTSSGDYITTSNEETVYQAVYFRLSEERGRQVRDNTYGVLSGVGEALSGEAPFELLSVSLQETLLQDPRITEVYGLNFIADQDTIYQEFKFNTVTKQTIDYREGL